MKEIEKLNLLRIKKGVTYAELSEKSGVGFQTTCWALKGQANVKISTLEKLAGALDTTLERLRIEDVQKVNLDNLSQRIRRLWISSGISYEELSKRAGVSDSTVYRVLNNNAKNRMSTIKRILIALDTSWEEFINEV